MLYIFEPNSNKEIIIAIMGFAQYLESGAS